MAVTGAPATGGPPGPGRPRRPRPRIPLVVAGAVALLSGAAAACGGGPTFSAAQAQGRALRFAEAVGGRDTAVLHRLVTEDYVLHAGPLPGGELRGRAAFLARVAADTTWPRGRIVVTRMVGDGDQVAVYGLFAEGGSPLRPGSEPHAAEGMVPVAAFHRFEQGRIAETWAVWDGGAPGAPGAGPAARDSAGTVRGP